MSREGFAKPGVHFIGMSFGDVSLLVRSAYSDFLPSQLSGDPFVYWCKEPTIASSPTLEG
jgi:hypothetical protein